MLMGPTGLGQATKATNQILCAGAIQAASEAMAFARAEGLPLEKVIEILGSGAGSSWYFVNRAPFMARGAYPAGFRVRLHDKDLRICREMAARHGAVLPVVEATLADFARLLVAQAMATRTSRRFSASRRRCSPSRPRRTETVPSASSPLIRRERAGLLPAGFLPGPERAGGGPDRRAGRTAADAGTTRHLRGVLARLAHTSLFLLWVGTRHGRGAVRYPRTAVAPRRARSARVLALVLMLIVTALVTEGAWWLSDYSSRMLGLTAPVADDGPPAVPAAQPRGLRNRRRPGAALLLRVAPVARNVEAEAAAPRACAAGAHPAAFPVQQHEHHRLADAHRPAARRAGDRGSFGPVPRVAARAPRDHPAGERDRDRARLRAHRAPAARRPPAGGLAARRAADGCADPGADPATAARERRVPRHRAARQRRHDPRHWPPRRRQGRVITIGNPVEPKLVARRAGHQIGLDNVRQRLELMFHGEADARSHRDAEHFLVTLRFPLGGVPA